MLASHQERNTTMARLVPAFILKRRTVVEAVIHLKERYQEQVFLFPRDDIPEALYVSRNLRAALSYYVPNPDYYEASTCADDACLT
jgi:hypothetical protein